MRFSFLILVSVSMAFAQNGRQLFVRSCSACHGDTGKGGRGPDLTTGDWKFGGSEDDLVRNMTKGIPGTQMPAIPMPEAEAKAIARFLIQQTQSGNERPTGDSDAGKALFFGTGKCAECHMFGGRGNIWAPDLTNARARFQPSALAKRMAEEIELVEANGTRGAMKGEDTFTLQMLDKSGKWHFLSRGAARKVTEAHPSLDSAQRNDIAAFLLQGKAEGPGEWKPAPAFNVSYNRLLNAAKEPHNWLMYWGNYSGTHYSGLKQVTPA
ncbi:MAG: c-type cytochrome, partial [Acidobacteria bacterium]|nr:c-type cytochrome [Acidobacteriota bacterium]